MEVLLYWLLTWFIFLKFYLNRKSTVIVLNIVNVILYGVIYYIYINGSQVNDLINNVLLGYIIYLVLLLFAKAIIWKSKFNITFSKKNSMRIFIANFLIHLFVVFFITSIEPNPEYFIINKLEMINISRIVLGILVVAKPGNNFFRYFLSDIKTKLVKEEKKPEEGIDVGPIIGVLERVLIFMLTIVGQWSSIGFVFTAKSIARMDMLKKEPKFADYYIIGTAYSLLYTVAMYVFIFKGVPLLHEVFVTLII